MDALWAWKLEKLISRVNLITFSDGFLNDITPMAASNHCVKHALLALSTTYVLDYHPSKELEKVANMHHKRAVILLSQALNNEETYIPGNEDAVVGALALMSQNDVTFLPSGKMICLG